MRAKIHLLFLSFSFFPDVVVVVVTVTFLGRRVERSAARARPSLMDKGMFTEKIYVARSEGGGNEEGEGRREGGILSR